MKKLIWVISAIIALAFLSKSSPVSAQTQYQLYLPITFGPKQMCWFEKIGRNELNIKVNFHWVGLDDVGIVVVGDPDPYGGGPSDYIVLGWSGEFEILVPYSTETFTTKALGYLDEDYMTPPQCVYEAPIRE